MPWPKVYTEAQREAVIRAWCDTGTRPAGTIARMARAGELTYEGEKVPSFEVPEASVREIGNREIRRRAGLAKSRTVDQEPRAAVESIRRRLAGTLDHEISRIERAQKRKGAEPIDGAALTKLCRAARELAAIPGPNDARPQPPPPTKAQDADNTLAGQLRRSVRGKPTTPPPVTHQHHEPTTNHQDHHTNQPPHEQANQPQDPQQPPPHTPNHTPNHTQEQDHNPKPGEAVGAGFGLLAAERVTVRPA